MRRVEVDDPAAEGAHDPPAAGVGAERDRAGGRGDHPQRQVLRCRERGSPLVISDQEDHAHRLLGVLEAVAERHGRGGDGLRQPEAAGDPVRRCGAGRSTGSRASPRRPAAKPTIGETTIGITTLSTIVDQCDRRTGGERGTDEPADQGVRRRRRQPEVPGDQVPDDRAEQPGEDDDQALGARSAGRSRSDTVCATFWPRNAPTKFITAARISATRGVRARVETEVAIALAASWKPLV